MLRIGICDENTKDRTVIRQIVTDTLFREEELSYIEYAEAETLEQEIQASTVPFDLLLMEMKYKNTSGLQLAKQIREKNLDVDLLFVTDESDHVYEGYHVQAQGYVLKEDMKTQLPDCLRQYMKRRAQTGTILVKSESVVRSIPIATIRYIESRARVLLFEYAEAETLEQEIQASTVPFDLLLMEMKYKNTSGLQLAKQIREKNLDVDLLFVTDESDHVYEGYHVQAQGYVLKEDMKTQLPDCLRQYMKRRAQTGTILVKSESVVRSIPIATIRYIESRARVLLLHTKNEVIPFYGKLADIEHKVLQHGFVRIHQSFLVRKAAIAAINGYEAVVGEDTLPISRKYYKTVQMQFQLKQKIQVAEEDIDPTVTRSLAKSMENNGAIIGTKGELLGIIYRMKDGESLTIGRDAEKCQIVLKKSNVSREHCIVRRLDDDTYEVEDCSKNGVYVEGAYLGKGNKVQAETGNRVWLCDESQEFRLG